MSRKIVILLLVIFIWGLLFPILALAGDYKYGNKDVHYEGLVPCGKSESSLPAAYDEEGNLIKEEESLEISYPCEFCHLFVMLDGIIDFVLIKILPPVIALMMVIAGIMFFFAGGNPSLLLQSKKLITSVVIGVVIILSAYLIVGTVLTVVGVQSWTTLDTWLDGDGIFMVNCPIGEGGIGGNGGNGGNGDNGDGEAKEEWSPCDPDNEDCEGHHITASSVAIGVSDTLDCPEGYIIKSGLCRPGKREDGSEYTVGNSGIDGNGWTCWFYDPNNIVGVANGEIFSLCTKSDEGGGGGGAGAF